MQPVTELSQALAAGTLRVRDLAERCLAEIAAREGEIHAFVHLDPAAVRAAADALDAARAAGRQPGPLFGLPVAVKDIIDTADAPTGNGTPLDDGRRPAADATLVSRLRAAGALILGKTVTTELAYRQPGPTRNPHALDHTPGGSSQGSAAAVAAGMAPLALGSQTVGSTIRPASYCGIVGFKPTHGRVPLTGVLNTAAPLDTIGAFATSVAGTALLVDAMQGFDPADPRTRPGPRDSLAAAVQAAPARSPRFALVGGPFWDEVSDDVRALFERLAEMLGSNAEWVDLPPAVEAAYPAHLALMHAEFAHNLAGYRERDDGRLSAAMREAMDIGAAVSAVEYIAARTLQTGLALELAPVFERYDAFLTPAAFGEAPVSLESTGDARCNALWTFLGVPAATVPAAVGSGGLPIGVQIVGAPDDDAAVARSAAWLETALAAAQ